LGLGKLGLAIPALLLVSVKIIVVSLGQVRRDRAVIDKDIFDKWILAPRQPGIPFAFFHDFPGIFLGFTKDRVEGVLVFWR
jgi:hypothetical protein